MEAAASSTEITILAWSVILLIVHIVAQTLSYVRDTSLGQAMGNREDVGNVSALTDRLTRSLRNFGETYVAFVGLALALVLAGKSGGMGATGATVWFFARVVYVPVFAAGIPVLRTAVWAISVFGILMMLARLMS